MTGRAAIDPVVEASQPDLLDRDRALLILAGRPQALRAPGREPAVLALKRPIRPQRVLGGRDRQHEKKQNA
jgi:hypothetical protein